MLPTAVLVIGGRPVSLRTITADSPSVLALIPPACQCVSALRQLGAQAAQAHVTLYLVGTGGGMKQVAQLASQAGLNSAWVADDQANALGRTYRPTVLTAILVHPGGAVASVTRLPPSQRPNLEASLRQLGSAGQ
jgi:hypothetical protein